MIGRLISGRYRIEAVVGTGGMAVVYRAQDEQKDQTVAIKVLRPEYESDMEFVRRFSREAEAAAKMSHENIVNLLDVGIEGDMRYIVMEFVDGMTLKDMIRLEGRIHPDVALRMTLRILAAVDHAHRNGIVHRDIKPQNILVDKQGQAKVADFGIARHKASQNTQLDPNGSALGSVHYLSPEQARGELADEQSDLYSVGVCMYEMLTGTVPFDGETTVSVALKHVSEEPASMRTHYAKISRALDEVVMRALCKDKERRYQTAAEMAADLRKTITHPKGGFVRYPKGKDAPADSAAQKEERKKKSSKPHRQSLWLVLAICITAAVCVMAVCGISIYRTRGNIPMPALIGLPQEEAVAAVEALGVDVMVVNAYSDEIPSGAVMLQSRNEGELVRKEAQITLTVSLGSQWYQLEDMTGWRVEEAEAFLRNAGVNNYSMVYIQSDAQVGSVLYQDVAPGRVSRDTPITLRICGQSVAVPSLAGMSLEGARAVIEAEGLVLGAISEGESADAKSGTVIAQSIAPYAQVLVGTTVDLTICRVQELRYAPDNDLSIVVPLNEIAVRIEIITPSGQRVEAYNGVLAAGDHRISLNSLERGIHTANIYMDDVLFESLQLDFE